MKTWALVLHLLFSDGSNQSFVDDSGLSAYDCAAQLTQDRPPLPRVAFKGGRNIRQVIVSCEQEFEI